MCSKFVWGPYPYVKLNLAVRFHLCCAFLHEIHLFCKMLLTSFSCNLCRCFCHPMCKRCCRFSKDRPVHSWELYLPQLTYHEFPYHILSRRTEGWTLLWVETFWISIDKEGEKGSGEVFLILLVVKIQCLRQ